MRPLAWLAVLCLALAAFALPASDAAAVGVQRIPALFQAPIAGTAPADAPAAGPAPARSLADRILDAAEPAGAGLVRFPLGGVRFTVPGVGTEDLTIHARARRSVASALRGAAHARGLRVLLDGERAAVEGGFNVLFTLEHGRLSARVRQAGVDFGASIPSPPGDRRALLPALVSIALVLLWRRPLLALLVGLAFGAGLWAALSPAEVPLGPGAAPSAYAKLLLGAFASEAAWKPLATAALLLAAWAVTARNGGLGGWTAWLGARASTPRRAQLATWCGAACAPFEAPGKNIALGWALRTNAVRARVSSEKFAWLLDSTGLAVVGLCAASPWAAAAFGIAETETGTRELWLATLPWRAFCWTTLALGLVVTLSGRDFGTMLGAERRSREALGAHGRRARRVFAAYEPDPRTALQPWRLVAPFAAFTLATLAQGLRDAGLFAGTFDAANLATWRTAAAAMARPEAALIAALAALLVALLLSAVGGAERGVPVALFRGLRTAVRPCLFLFGAWALGVVTTRLGAPEVLAASLGERVAPTVLPALAFLIGAGAAFCFGSAWAMLPLLVPLVCGLASSLGHDFPAGPEALAVISLAAVLEGTLAGALVSPWSQASLSASIGAGADHADHLRTQTPYALLSAGAALVFGFLPAGLYGLGAGPSLGLVAAAHVAVFVWLARASERRPAAMPRAT